MAYGALPHVAVGQVFVNRAALQAAGSHRDRESGIIGHADQLGAESIVINRSGHGYGDDLDHGDLVIYTGHGGRDPRSKKQVADQHFTHRNKTLALNVDTAQPVRVHRQTDEGFRYDGLFAVEAAWRSPGIDRYAVCRFRMRRLPDQAQTQVGPATPTARSSRRLVSTVSRLVRDGDIPQQVKAWHDYTCQACGTRLESATGPYAEGAHILPLGGGYEGPDVTGNVLCLCPNCHVQLDHGGLFVTDDLDILDRAGAHRGQLRTHPAHVLDRHCLRAHRDLFQFEAGRVDAGPDQVTAPLRIDTIPPRERAVLEARRSASRPLTAAAHPAVGSGDKSLDGRGIPTIPASHAVARAPADPSIRCPPRA